MESPQMESPDDTEEKRYGENLREMRLERVYLALGVSESTLGGVRMTPRVASYHMI